MLVGNSYQYVSPYREFLQIDFSGGLLAEDHIRLSFRIRNVGEINKREIRWSGLMNNLCRATLDETERSSQDFMAANQILQTLLQYVDIEWPGDAIAAHVRKGRAVLPAAPAVPDRLLQKRHGHGRRARSANDRRRLDGTQALIRVNECGKCRHRWMIGDCLEGQLDSECRVHLGRDNRADEGVATETKKIVVSTDIRQLKNFRPDFGKQHLRLCLGHVALGVGVNRKRILTERLSIDLVALIVRKAVQKHDP